MTTTDKKDREYLILDNTVDLPIRLDAGQCEGRFLVALRDEKRIWANKCPKCGRQLVVPRPVCAHCYDVEMTEWVEQGDEGVLEHFSISYYPFVHPRTGKIKPVPWANGIIRLDGGAQIWHEVVPPDPEKLKIGDRFKAVWKEEGRTGFIGDILHFERIASDAPAKPIVRKDKKPPELKEPHSLPGMLLATYHHAAGDLAGRFFFALRDEKKITGSKCPKCRKVYAPPMSTCTECFSKIDELVELSGKGTLTNFTVIHYAEPAHPFPAPFAYGVIQLDGADTGMTHFLGDVDLDRISIGMRVEPVFKQQRVGNMLDIKYFRQV